ncbi:outer membrane protein assembly factor BamE [Pseudothauera nasutitermitis]|uniref:Outer membrane protein assembly factor BamE n=1 Tax=Pseudothauera nasutitermitis TaxID=2565930 RepID=A0A4S4AMG7_9RHOO|nr:outer membrane protein assembly factor BamE [Pseudothauera nasutitermitis]THF60790.1 outer membrane protein assembly factor BamE [Pseudothauera nasutitermitis]
MNTLPITSSLFRWPARLALLLLVAALSGCAAFAPPRPFTTEAEALAARGEPTARWPNEDGSTVLEFATQPYGTTCLMVEVDATGVVLRQWDALAAENLARVKVGMTQDEVRRLLGQYRSIQRFANSGEEVWDWNVPKDYYDVVALRFNVHFVDSKVVRTSQSYEYPRDRWMFGVGVGRGSPYWGMGWGHRWGYPWGGYPYWHPWWGW